MFEKPPPIPMAILQNLGTVILALGGTPELARRVTCAAHEINTFQSDWDRFAEDFRAASKPIG